MASSLFKVSTLTRCFVVTGFHARNIMSSRNMTVYSSFLLRCMDMKLQPACSSLCIQKRNYWWERTAKWISESQPVLVTQDMLQYVHDFSALPWWANIVLTTVTLRFVVTFPLTIYQHVITARFRNLQPEIAKIADELKKETAIAMKMYDWPKKYARYMFNRSMKKQVTKLIVQENCHPFKTTVVMWVQLPMWISLSFAYRNMVSMMPYHDTASHILFMELATGGLLWFPNLTVPDASWILPVSLGLINLAIIEVHALKKTKVTRMQKGLTYFMRGVSVLLIPIAASVPSCMAFYWTVSSAVGLIQNLILAFPNARRTFRIPEMVDESPSPFINSTKDRK